MSSPPEGVIRIELNAGQGTARIENLRPLSLSGRFSGRTPAEVASLVPLVFSICRAAQSAAADEAFENALAVTPDARQRTIRELLTLGEAAREHALQVLHAWPPCLKAPEPAMDSASIKRLLKIDRELSLCLGQRPGGEAAIETAGLLRMIHELTGLLGEAVFAELPEEWLSRRHIDGLSDWSQRNETQAQTAIEYLIHTGMADAGAAEIAPLPPVQPQELLDILLSGNAASFVARPEWEGKPREATPLARLLDHPLVASIKSRHGYGLLARLCACLIELAAIPGRMLSLAASLDGQGQGSGAGAEGRNAGKGLGTAEASRGRLIHAVEIVDGLVQRYRILAPTEWNFHPEGATARGLAQIAKAAPQHREWLARLFITAVDPCVGFDLRLS